MHLHGLASAFPPFELSQAEALRLLAASPHADRLRAGSMALLTKILSNPASGIQKRRFCTEDLPNLFRADAETLNQYYEAEAPKLGCDAVRKALQTAGIAPDAVDALFVCTCTGFLCPGVSSHVAEQLGLREDIGLIDQTGLGCGAALPMLRAASDFLQANPNAYVVTLAVEVCSAAFFLDDDAGVLISATLFGDGAAAAVWHGKGGDTTEWRAHDFRSIHRPEHREKLRFENRGGFLRNRLEREVPEVAAEVVAELHAAAGLPAATRVISHGGGRNVLEAVRERLPGHSLADAAWALERYGNVSSPSVLIALERALAQGWRGESWLVSFGAGFSAHACRLSPAAQNGA